LRAIGCTEEQEREWMAEWRKWKAEANAHARVIEAVDAVRKTGVTVDDIVAAIRALKREAAA
jgi:hypothetical protein